MSPPEIRPMSEEPAAESDSKSNQSLQPRESRNGKEQQGWITQTEWTIYIQENSDDDRRSPFVVSIFRVPSLLKNLKREAYVPEIVSLGPYHHRRAELPPMGNHKGRAVRRMKKRFNESNKRNLAIYSDNIDFSDRAREEIVKLEKQIRDSYEEKLDCDGNTLALILTLDGCFLLEILRTLEGDLLRDTGKYYDPIFGERKICFAGSGILEDIVMLENQIPFIVLQKLLELEFNSVDDVKDKLLSMMLTLLYNYIPKKDIDVKQWSWPKEQEQVHHLLGLLHSFIVSPHSNQSEPADGIDHINCSSLWSKCIESSCVWSKLVKCRSSWRKYIKFRSGWCSPLHSRNRTVNNVRRIRCAIELSKAGIKFKRCNQDIKMIKFDPKNATILLPKITVMDNTEVLFRNLIAFEMCKPSEINYITCYVSLMDELIDSEEDVALLIKSDIVTNYLGSDAHVAHLFNGLIENVTMTATDAFAELKGDVREHYRNEMKVQLAEFVKEHLSSPWRTVALAAAILILLLTTVQTIFSVLSVYN